MGIPYERGLALMHTAEQAHHSLYSAMLHRDGSGRHDQKSEQRGHHAPTQYADRSKAPAHDAESERPNRQDHIRQGLHEEGEPEHVRRPRDELQVLLTAPTHLVTPDEGREGITN